MIKLKFNSWVFQLPFYYGYAATCLGRTIHFRDSKEQVSIELLAHELVHQAQMDDHGVIPFYLAYFYQWVRYGFSYKKIPFEIEAYECQSLEHWQNQARIFLLRGV